MIYIINKENNTITTDSWIETKPSSIKLYFDDILIGDLVNESTKNEYIVVTIPKENLVHIENKEYNFKFINLDNMTLIKIELGIVKSNVTITSNTVTNKTNKKFYE